MNWYYDAGAGERQGPISEAELDALIASGRISPSTLVWREGMADWAPLETVRGSAGPATAGIPSATGFGTTRCDACGVSVQEGDLIQIGARKVCANCKPVVLQQIQSGVSLDSLTERERSGPPWERRGEIGFVAAAWETVKAVISEPVRTFENMRREGGLASPLYYLLLLGSIGSFATLFYQFAVSFGPMARQSDKIEAAFGVGLGVAIMIWIVLIPIILFIASFISSGIFHLSLMACGGAKQPFETTFRTYCYAAGSTAALQLIPVCGQYVHQIWTLVLLCIGLSKTHGISGGRATAAVLIPIAICCALVFGVAMFAGFAAAAAARGH